MPRQRTARIVHDSDSEDPSVPDVAIPVPNIRRRGRPAAATAGSQFPAAPVAPAAPSHADTEEADVAVPGTALVVSAVFYLNRLLTFPHQAAPQAPPANAALIVSLPSLGNRTAHDINYFFVRGDKKIPGSMSICRMCRWVIPLSSTRLFKLNVYDLQR
jgi:hypothetical protein